MRRLNDPTVFDMSKKTSKRSSSKSPAKAPILKTIIRGLLRFFEADLPVTEFHGTGKFSVQVAGVRQHQASLESICGARSAKSQKILTTATITPETREKSMRVEIEGKVVGQLKPADAKALEKQLAAAQMGPCALIVSALVQGGRRKKNGDLEDFTVALRLPPNTRSKPAAAKKAAE
jgi:hypothetical protein